MNTPATPQHMTPILHDVVRVSEGWINKYILTYQLPDGSFKEYESVSRKGLDDYFHSLQSDSKPAQVDAVCIVPRTLQDEIVLIKEFRYPLNSWCVAFPAGLKEPDESIESCVDRELREETGYGVVSKEGSRGLCPLSQPGYSSTGMSEESIHVVYALVEKQGEAQPEPSEFIETFTVPISKIPQFLEENTLPIGTRAQLILETFVAQKHWEQC